MKPAEHWVKQLELQAHPEGGFYKETYRSTEIITRNGLPDRFTGTRNFSTAIYFLLRSEDCSMFHRIKSDELWHFHDGSALTIYILNEEGLTSKKLGPHPEHGESLQVVIPANCWFGALVDDAESYTLSGCTVSPGFDFNDFELADRGKLLKEYPDHAGIITRLSK